MKPLVLIACIWAGLWLAACSHSVATKTTLPAGQESRQPTEKSQAPSSEKAQSRPQENRETSSTSQTDAVEPTRSAPDEKQATTGTARTGSPDEAVSKLEQARENLRLSQSTEKRIASELDQLKQSGNASAEVIRDYESYLEHVQAMVAENRKVVDRMEAAYARHSGAKSTAQPTAAGQENEMRNPDIPEAQAVDEVTALDRQLDRSLAKFDDMLLKEMDEIRASSAEKMQDLAREAAEAAKRLREKGFDSEGTGSDSSDETQTEKEMESAAGEQGAQTTVKDSSRKGGEGPAGKDQRRIDYEDDDIVARQLREAAENETDPELKEKLWKEYEEYKKNQP